ncbi:hypothetical protein [Clostridium sp. Marseille-P299]|uniref:hypothetical protein n=1 Tax=Clostridium sp. Marseille-P299 TaxID=1805477 RepID=UPI000836095C|nr:hypothetical protein [Clostridium sp. Marseille-P299]
MRKFILKEKYETLIQELIDDYNLSHSYQYIMGPNALCLIEILCEKMTLKPGMRVLDSKTRRTIWYCKSKSFKGV